MGVLWNHWFWITLTLGLSAKVLGESLPLKLEETIQDGEEGLVELRVGARGGKFLPIPENGLEQGQVPERSSVVPRSSVSVSKSVSKVEVKMGQISVQPEEPSLPEKSSLPEESSPSEESSLSEISDIYVDRGIDNLLEAAPRPQARRIDPQYISYNLVYREPRKVTTPRPPGLLETIIAKLKSLARATTSQLRLSSLLQGEDGSESPEPLQPTAETIEPVLGYDFPGSNDRTHRPGNVFLRIDDLRVSAGDPVSTDVVETDDEITETDEIEPEPDSRIDSNPVLEEHVPRASPRIEDDLGRPRRIEDDLGRPQRIEEDLGRPQRIEEDLGRPRSLAARGRSLPLHLLEEIEIKSSPATGGANELDTFVRVEEMKGEDWNKEEMGWSRQEEEVVERVEEQEEGLINQADFNEDFSSGLDSEDEDIRIEAEKMDAANISAIVGVVVGIIIFIIISIVLVLLAVQRRGRMKKAGPAEDVISQSSYMTYSTTVSDHSVNYGPSWEKDIADDLCSLDNDSFLNSLEAVATTDYWVDCKY